MFYMFEQNNSGGRFDVNDALCHRVVIEANSEREAIYKAEELGCYWDGVENGIDCHCCGDRWYSSPDEIDIEKYAQEGYRVGVYGGIYKSAEDKWNEQYRKYDVIEEPKWEQQYSVREYVGRIQFHSIEEYMQYLADKYGWTTPDARIFYQDGTVKAIFSNKN